MFDKIKGWFTTGLGKLLDNPKPVTVIVAVFISLFFLFLSFSANASDGRLELGPTYTGEFNGGAGLIYTERLKGKYDVGIALLGEQKWDGKTTGNNGNVFGQRIVKYKKAELGLGAAYWIKTDDRIIGCKLGYTMMLRWNFTDRLAASIRHWSNAGVCKPNRGQDLLTIGWRF